MHISLAILLMISSVGIVVSVHYCHDKLASISIFKESKTCCTNPNCCQNETISIQFDEDYVVQDLQSLKKIIIAPILYSFIDFQNQFLWRNENFISFNKMKESPPLVSDITIQIQCFLI